MEQSFYGRMLFLTPTLNSRLLRHVEGTVTEFLTLAYIAIISDIITTPLFYFDKIDLDRSRDNQTRLTSNTNLASSKLTD
jgi:hypothetical protein